MVDMKFIARKAGVSSATVSRVLNQTKRVSPELEERVLEVVARYHYTPNGFGRGLVTGRSHMVGVVTSSQLNMYETLLLSQVNRFATQKGYSVVILNAEEDFESRMRAFEILQAQRVDGVACAFELSRKEYLRVKSKLNIPLLSGGDLFGNISLSEANRAVTFEAASYLKDLGHVRVGAVLPPLERKDSFLAARCNGFLQAAEDLGCIVRPSYLVKNVRNMPEAAEGILDVFRRKDRPTALFCYSDEVAIGTMFSLMQNGFSIPRDISVVGFDGIPMGKMITPKLTTIEQDIKYMTMYYVDKLIAMVEGKEYKRLLPEEPGSFYRVFIGGSCCPPHDL